MAAPAFSLQHQNAARLADPALRQALLKYARRRLPPAEVEDLVQSTLTDALVSPNTPSDDGEFRRWVQGIARHKVADSYRRRGRLPILDADLDAKAGEAFAATGELTQWIERELPNTEGANATLHWLLREGDGESLDEIAREAALPAPRVRQRVSRLRRHFHARWLALGAAGLLLLLVAGLLLHRARIPAPVPPIAHEVVPPLEAPAPRAIESASPPQRPALAPPQKTLPKQLAPRKAHPKPAPKKAQPKVQSNAQSNAEPRQSNALPLAKSKAEPTQSKLSPDSNDVSDSKDGAATSRDILGLDAPSPAKASKRSAESKP